MTADRHLVVSVTARRDPTINLFDKSELIEFYSYTISIPYFEIIEKTVFDFFRANYERKEAKRMQVKGFLLTLGLGMVAGGTVALMLPQNCAARKTTQKAVDAVEQSVSKMVN